MGIPSFYAWLRKRYPLIRLRLEDEAREIPLIDNMFIDFNALIYRCVREERHFLMNELHPRSVDEIYGRVVEYVEELVDRVNPSKLLYIAFDGVVPRAKINQSRERRFKASKEKELVGEFYQQLGIKDIENFKLNSISPGTQFLYVLCNKLKTHILSKMDSDWKHLNVIYSDCCTPGEGEQKILEFIRMAQNKNLFNPLSTHCVYSPDADLFLLMFSTRLPNIYIIREEFLWSKNTTEAHLRKEPEVAFEIVFINILREYFEIEFQELKQQLRDFDIHRVIDDFVLIMMFVGNDFLPKSFSYNIKEGHLTELLTRYKEYLVQRKDYVNNRGKINWSNTEELLRIASQFEVKLIQEKLAKKTQNQKQREGRESGGEYSDSEDEEFVKEFVVQDNTLTKGRSYYYQSRFGFNPEKLESDKALEGVIQKYVEGLEFYVSYYYLGCQSWSWYYPYHYAPLLTDVYDYIKNKKVQQVKLQEKGQPFDPFMALMFMMPQHSFSLLPVQLKNALMSQTCVLRGENDTYPLTFKMDPFVAATDFEQKALIPFLDEAVVRQVYASVAKDKFSKEEAQRNVRRNPIFFHRIGEGKMEHTTGTEFSLLRENDVNELAKNIVKPTTETRERFPSLKLYYAGSAKIDKWGVSIFVERRHKPVKDEVVFFNHFQGVVEEVIKADKDMTEAIESEYGKIGIIGKCEDYARIKILRLVRDSQGYRLVKTMRQVVVPDFAIFKTPDYDYLRRTLPFNIKTQYNPLDRVVIMNKANFGDIGVVEGEEGNFVTLRIMESSQQLASKLEENEQPFYTLKYVCEHLQLSKEVLYTIMDEVIVKTNKKQQFGKILPDEWNLGLSLIDRRRGVVVPKYTRCQHEYENPKNSFAIFDYVEVSESGLKLIQQYIKDLPEVVQAVKTELSKGGKFLKGAISFNKIMPDGQNIDIARLYLKLYHLEAKGREYRIYSKITSQQPQWQAKEKEPGILKIDPIYLMSKIQARVSPLPYLKRQPEYHMVGDRVIVTRTHQTGVVVGIDDHCMVVRFPRKQRSYKYEFTELFNEKWVGSLERQEGPVWNLDYSYYSPTYWNKAIDHQDSD